MPIDITGPGIDSKLLDSLQLSGLVRVIRGGEQYGLAQEEQLNKFKHALKHNSLVVVSETTMKEMQERLLQLIEVKISEQVDKLIHG